MPLLVLIGGGHAAGKSTAARAIRDDIVPAGLSVLLIDMDSYMDPDTVTTAHLATDLAITVGSKPLLTLKPSRFDFEKLLADVRAFLASPEPQSLLIVHGLYALYDRTLCDLASIKVYIDSDADTRLVRWIRRDVLSTSNHVPLDVVINSYLQGAKQEMADFIFPTKERADVIMPRGPEPNGISLIVDGLLSYSGRSISESQAENLRPIRNQPFDKVNGKFYELS